MELIGRSILEFQKASMKFLLQNILLAAFLVASINLSAQNFKSAVGARLGYPTSASYKMFINDNDAFEGTAGIRFRRDFNEVRVGGAYQRHNSFNLDGDFAPLKWYYGAGASIGFLNYKSASDARNNGSVGLGVSGYLGVQYTVDHTPLELTLDWAPTLNLGNTLLDSFDGAYVALGVRYILNY